MNEALPAAPALLQPVAALLAWSMVVWAWMYLARVAAVLQHRRGRQSRAAQWINANFAHLMEQPTLFYATVMGLIATHDTARLSVLLAWAYAVLRVAHSLWQVAGGARGVRLVLFGLSTLPLFALVTRLAMRVF